MSKIFVLKLLIQHYIKVGLIQQTEHSNADRYTIPSSSHLNINKWIWSWKQNSKSKAQVISWFYEFSSKTVQHCINKLTALLVSIKSINHLKKANFPLHKQLVSYTPDKIDPTTELQNYRPITLVSTFANL